MIEEPSIRCPTGKAVHGTCAMGRGRDSAGYGPWWYRHAGAPRAKNSVAASDQVRSYSVPPYGIDISSMGPECLSTRPGYPDLASVC